MNVTKYRKWYLHNNLDHLYPHNTFLPMSCVVENWNTYRSEPGYNHNHPLVLAGNAYWISNNELCIGFTMRKNPEIFRPIFSHKRQRILNKVNKNILKPSKFWNKIKSRYFLSLSKIKKLPIDCVKNIVMFIY